MSDNNYEPYETEKQCFNKAYELVKELSANYNDDEIHRIGLFLEQYKFDYSSDL